jgi:stage III sporulation protein AF
MSWLTDSIKEIVVILILVSIISNLIPEENYKKYLRLISGIMIILIIINPIKKILNEEGLYYDFAEEYKKNDIVELKKSMDNINSEIYTRTKEEYENEIAYKLKNSLEQRGYIIEETEVTMDIEEDLLYIENVYIEISNRYGSYDDSVEKSTIKFIKSYLWEEYSINEDIVVIEYE